MSSEAFDLATAHKNKPWARRWLRAHKKAIVPLTEVEEKRARKAAQRILGIQRYVKGAVVSL
jgi:hypothetical protein